MYINAVFFIHTIANSFGDKNGDIFLNNSNQYHCCLKVTPNFLMDFLNNLYVYADLLDMNHSTNQQPS